jgi:hypothetical protein
VVVARIFLAETTNSGFGGAGGGGVPSGIFPMMRAVVGVMAGAAAGSRESAIGSSWERTNAVAANMAANTNGDVFMS